MAPSLHVMEAVVAAELDSDDSLPLQDILCTGCGDVGLQEPFSGVALLDCGANVVCISPRVFAYLREVHQVQFSTELFSVRMGDGTESEPTEHYFCDVLFRLTLNTVPLTFRSRAAVKETGRDVILSHYLLKTNGIHLFLHDPELFRQQHDMSTNERENSVLELSEDNRSIVEVHPLCLEREKEEGVRLSEACIESICDIPRPLNDETDQSFAAINTAIMGPSVLGHLDYDIPVMVQAGAALDVKMIRLDFLEDRRLRI